MEVPLLDPDQIASVVAEAARVQAVQARDKTPFQRLLIPLHPFLPTVAAKLELVAMLNWSVLVTDLIDSMSVSSFWSEASFFVSRFSICQKSSVL